jgi:hypothetical protein
MPSGKIFQFNKQGEKCLTCGERTAKIGELSCQDCENKYNAFQRKLQGRKMKIQSNGNLCDR